MAEHIAGKEKKIFATLQPEDGGKVVWWQSRDSYDRSGIVHYMLTLNPTVGQCHDASSES